ncbi:hypothetical protein BC628DRAFT_3928 [Trametes gibbosa]|nr:hypothetical protein BC628DRAFT_3928 [Trametes gibbosa]
MQPPLLRHGPLGIFALLATRTPAGSVRRGGCPNPALVRARSVSAPAAYVEGQNGGPGSGPRASLPVALQYWTPATAMSFFRSPDLQAPPRATQQETAAGTSTPRSFIRTCMRYIYVCIVFQHVRRTWGGVVPPCSLPYPVRCAAPGLCIRGFPGLRKQKSI